MGTEKTQMCDWFMEKRRLLMIFFFFMLFMTSLQLGGRTYLSGKPATIWVTVGYILHVSWKRRKIFIFTPLFTFPYLVFFFFGFVLLFSTLFYLFSTFIMTFKAGFTLL